MVNEYTPDEFNVRMAWVTTGIGPEDNLNAEFDRWLAGVKADAWDEGWVSRHNYDERGGEAPTPNPYEDRHVDQ